MKKRERRTKLKITKRLNVENEFNLETIEGCRNFLSNLYLGGSRVKAIALANGEQVKMEDIPDNQIIQRAEEICVAIKGNKNS